MFEIACETGWSHDSILDLPPVAAFYYCLLAIRRKTEEIEGYRLASSFPWMEEKDRQSLVQKFQVLLAGPGRVPKWDDGLTDSQREELRQDYAALDATIERIVSRGAVRVSAEGTKDPSALFDR